MLHTCQCVRFGVGLSQLDVHTHAHCVCAGMVGCLWVVQQGQVGSATRCSSTCSRCSWPSLWLHSNRPPSSKVSEMHACMQCFIVSANGHMHHTSQCAWLHACMPLHVQCIVYLPIRLSCGEAMHPHAVCLSAQMSASWRDASPFAAAAGSSFIATASARRRICICWPEPCRTVGATTRTDVVESIRYGWGGATRLAEGLTNF